MEIASSAQSSSLFIQDVWSRGAGSALPSSGDYGGREGVLGKGVGQDFGFPRMEQLKKKYRWKKMNFTTDLPKRSPYVTYVVASAMRAHIVEEN